MQTRSIGVSGICCEKKRDIEDILKDIHSEFGDEFEIEVDEDKVCIRGELHNHKVRYRLHEIITGERIGG